jgi:hypothetical protein
MVYQTLLVGDLIKMKYKLTALILGLSFAGISQAGTLTFSYTLSSNIFAPGTTFTSGDTLSGFAFSGGGSGTINNMQTETTQSVTLYTVNFNPVGTTNNGGNTITSQDTLTITSPASSPTALSFISAAFLDSVSGGGTSTLSDTLATTTSVTYVFSATGYRLTVTPTGFTTIGPTASNTTQVVSVAANFTLVSPEPGTWVLLGSSLIGLGLLARRRKMVA